MVALLGCRSAALVIEAGISIGRNPFLKVTSREYREETEDRKPPRDQSILDERERYFSKVGNSDHALLAGVYRD